MVHGKNVDHVATNRVVDAVGEAMKTRSANAIVHDGIRIGMSGDPREASIDCAKEGFA